MEKMMRVHTGIFAMLIGFVCASTLLAADWRVGLARADITPPEPIWLFGHVSRSGPSTGVIHSLWAKVIVIDDGRGERVVLITTDLPGMQNREVVEICARIAKKTGLERKQIAVNFSHTHSGPVLSGLLTPGYRALVQPPEHWEVIDAYTRMTHDRIVEAVAEATEGMRPANLAYGEDSCKIRNDALTALEDEINRDRPFHDRVPVLRVTGPDDEILAVIFGYASHPNSTDMQIHGGYAGYAQIQIEKQYHGAQAMFVMGCGALSVTRASNLSETDGRQLAEAVFRGLERPMETVRPGKVQAAFDRVALPLLQPATKQMLEQRRREGIRGRFIQKMDEYLLEHAAEHGAMPTGHAAPQQVLRIGDDLTFVMLSGEIAEGYAYRISEIEYPGRRMWVAGFTNDLYAYVPTEEVLRAGTQVSGGRVGGTSQLFWGWPSRWANGIEDHIVNKVKELVEVADADARQ